MLEGRRPDGHVAQKECLEAFALLTREDRGLSGGILEDEDEVAQQGLGPVGDEVEISLREALGLVRCLGEALEERPDLVGKRCAVDFGHPARDGVGHQLTLDHRHGVQIDAGRLNVAAQHLGRIRPEVLRVGIVAAHRHGKRIAVAAARTPDALDVIRLLGRHGGKEHRREVADVDAHFERWGGRQKIDVPGLPSFAEALFNAPALGAFDVGRVFPGNRPAWMAQIELLGFFGGTHHVLNAGTGLREAGHGAPHFLLFLRNDVPASAAIADHARKVAAHRPCLRIKKINGRLVISGHVDHLHEPRFNESGEESCVHLFHGRKNFELSICKAGGNPGGIPVVAVGGRHHTIEQLVEIPALCVGHLAHDER